MDKRLLFSAVLAAMISANEAKAFTMAFPTQVVAQAESSESSTEITDQYLKNAGFDTEADFQTADIGTGQQTKSLLTDWTWAGDGGYVLGASFQIGSSSKLNKNTVPTTNADGGTTGGVLGFSIGWGGKAVYTQDVNDLPAGVYHIEYAAYNTNDKGVAKNLIGYVDEDGKTYYGTKTSFAQGQWVKETINFEVAEGKTGKISVGFQSEGKGSDNQSKICIDYIKIYKGIEIPAKADAQAALAKYDYQGEERTALENLVNSNPSTLAEAEALNTNIITATNAFCKAAEDVTDVATDYRKNYEAMRAEYTYDASSLMGYIDAWEGNMILNTANEHWSGQTTGYWEQTGDMWGQNSWTVSKKTSVSLPVGKYALVAATRASSDVTGYLKVGENSLAITNKGNTGLGIDTNGNATNNPYATYANNNAGRGWEWRYIEFEVTDASQAVTIEMGGSASSKNQWMSIGDIQLLSTPDNYIGHVKDINDNYKYDATPYLGDATAWEGTFSINDQNQHWSGDESKTYFDHWQNGTWKQSKKTTLSNLPAGKYVFMAAGRGSSGTKPYIKVGDNTVYFATKNGEGKGIDINGNATVDESATYSNNNVGGGWEWRYIEFEVVNDNDPVSLEIGASGPANTWASIGDLTLKSAADKQHDINVAALANAITAAQNAVDVVKLNVGEKAFQIPQSFVTPFTEAIATAKATLDNTAATNDELATATTTLTEAVADCDYTKAVLNKPAEGEKFNIIINGNSGYTLNGKTLTFKANDGAGGYAMGYTEDGGSFYNQALTMVPTENDNEYILAIDEADGSQTYVGTGVNYGGNAQQLRAVTDKAKALPVKIEVTAAQGLYNLRNTSNNQLIAANGEKDSGFFTSNKQWNNFNLVEAVKNQATLKVTAAKWATFIAPFEVAVPKGVEAYTCAGVEGNGNVITLAEASVIKANTPYILYAESPVEQTVEGYALANTDTYAASNLTGVYAEKTVAQGNYVLQNQESGKVAFYAVTTDDIKCGANRAYFTAPAEASEAKFFSFDAGTSAINGLLGNGAVEVERYNAAGVRVDAPVKGLNIVKLSNGTILKQIIK